MQRLIFIFLFVGCFGYSQHKVNAVQRDSTSLKAKDLFGIDAFGTTYFTSEDNSFHKKSKDTTLVYSNFQLGEITSANTFNPLKINLFYKDLH